jgi:hypothetical protein
VTGTVSEEFAVSCLQKGADDYILKTNLPRLPSAINHSLRELDSNIVKNAVDLLGGEIILNIVGVGTEFMGTLPLRK